MTKKNVTEIGQGTRIRKKAFVPIPKGLVVALRIANAIPVERRVISRDKLIGANWSNLRWLIKTLTIDLQLFCLQEGIDIDGQTYFFSDELALRMSGASAADLQVATNLLLPQKGEAEVKRLVEAGFARMDEISEEHPFSSVLWIRQVRERVLLAFAVRQLVHCMAHPRELQTADSTSLYDGSSWSSAYFQIREGKVKFQQSVLISLLEGVEVARVRECPVCFKYFWAGRINMRCCSTAHAGVLRMREYRTADRHP